MCFNDSYSNELPFYIKVIEDYTQMLLPIYCFTTDLQHERAHIGLVIPALLTVIYENLDRMVLKDENQNQLRNDLIQLLLSKFDLEFNSKEYLVAAILNVGYLSNWAKRSFSSKYYQAGLDSIFEVLNKYTTNDFAPKTTKVDKVVQSFSGLTGLTSLRSITKPRLLSDSDDLNQQSRTKILTDETQKFINIINNTEFDSPKGFWLKHKSSLPNLYNLALKLLSIPATSAYIERFFSITGQINNKQANQMSPELLEIRSMLKANLNLL